VKRLKVDNAHGDVSGLEDEVFVLRQLSHPNIVSFVDMVEARRYKYIIMEYCEGGDLRGLINQAIKTK
jgi:serine/threonine protein kinase